MRVNRSEAADRLRIIQVAEDLSPLAGGVPAVVRQLSAHMSNVGARVQVVHSKGEPTGLPSEIQVRTLRSNRLGRAWSWSTELSRVIRATLTESPEDRRVVHIHGAWGAPQYLSARHARDVQVPFVFTAHGMLEPWLWERQGAAVRWKKQMYWSSVGKSAISAAHTIHAITPLERDTLSRLLPRSRTVVIPNAVEINNSDGGVRERRKSILFIGRIEPIKGVDLLLKAFADAKLPSEWVVDVVGPTWSEKYLQALKEFVLSRGLGERVFFHGPAFGSKKTEFLETAWILVAPSHSEVVGLVNLESANSFLPSITTHQTGLHDWESGGGLLINPDETCIRKALVMAASWSTTEQRERGLASRQLVARRYSWQAVLPQWSELYRSIIE
jgi:glycosyltransferase involved in cell wall biosynthesis